MLEKHSLNGDQIYYTWIRDDLLSLLPDDINIDKSLDVGCGAGNTSEYLKRKFDVRETVGIEVVPAVAAQAAARLDRVHNISVEDERLPFQENEFDLVLFADVLEHLVDPWSVLQRFVRFVKPGGYILTSLPNIQNWKILLQLFFGRWEYQDGGIMDRTHLRFFTVKSALQLVHIPGLRVVRLERTMGRTLKALNVLTFGLFRNHFTYHIYVLAQKSMNE